MLSSINAHSGGSMSEPGRSRRAREARGDHAPVWVQVVGVCFLAVTLIFLMILVFFPIPCENRWVVITILALTVSAAFGFLGGSATMKGSLPLPGGLRSHPIAVSLAGGVAVFAIVWLLGWLLYYRADCSSAPSEPRISRIDPSFAEGKLFVSIEFEILNIKPGEIAFVKVGSDRTLSQAALWLLPQKIEYPRRGRATILLEHHPTDQGWVQITIEDEQGRLIVDSDPRPFKVPAG